MYIFLDLKKKMVFKNSSRGAGIDPPLRRANHSRFYDMNLTPATKPYIHGSKTTIQQNPATFISIHALTAD